MGSKKIDNPVELRVIIHSSPNGDSIDVAKICYSVTAEEYGISEARMLVLLETDELRKCTHDLAEEAIRQVDIHEEIEEVDSLLEYPLTPPA